MSLPSLVPGSARHTLPLPVSCLISSLSCLLCVFLLILPPNRTTGGWKAHRAAQAALAFWVPPSCDPHALIPHLCSLWPFSPSCSSPKDPPEVALLETPLPSLTDPSPCFPGGLPSGQWVERSTAAGGGPGVFEGISLGVPHMGS